MFISERLITNSVASTLLGMPRKFQTHAGVMRRGLDGNIATGGYEIHDLTPTAAATTTTKKRL